MNDDSHGVPSHAPRAVLYTRVGCRLCDEAKSLLEQHGLRPKCVDIDTDPALVEIFGKCVPVVEINGQVRFRGRVEPVLLRRILDRIDSDGH